MTNPFDYLNWGAISVAALAYFALGALTGCCFCAATIGVNYLYEKKPFGLFLINAGYAVIGNIIAGVIICSWY